MGDLQLEIQQDDAGDVTVLAISGRVDSLTAPALGEKMIAALGAPNARLIADLSGVEYLSSAGLRVLLQAMKQAQKAKGKLVLHGLNARVAEVFEISGFNSILTVCGTRDEALALIAA